MDGSILTRGTESILIVGIFAESEYASTVDTTTYTNDETIKFTNVTYSDIKSDEG